MSDLFDELLGIKASPDTRSEKAILNDTLVAVSALPETLVYRNNTGQAWQGRKIEARIGSMVKVEPGMVILADARPVNFGLPGSGDIMGASKGRPLAIEVKDLTGAQSESQRLFGAAWTRAGGLYVLARSPAEAIANLR